MAAPFDAAAGRGAPTHAKVEFRPVAGGFVVSNSRTMHRKAPLLVGSAPLGVNNSLTL